MSLYERTYPTLVSLLGSLGLGTALAYFIGIAFMFQSGSEEWVLFFLVWGPWLVVIPAGALIAHLYLRTHLGRWLVERGRLEEAVEYTSQRLEAGLTRSRRETIYHRVYLARAHTARGNYEEALSRLTRGFAMPDHDETSLKIWRWQMENALRVGAEEVLEEAFDAAAGLEVKGEKMKTLRACRAEWAALNDERAEFEAQLDEARWPKLDPADKRESRVDFAEAIGRMIFGRSRQDLQMARSLLERSREEMLAEIPLREAEYDALRTESFIECDEEAAAEEALEAARRAPGDARSERAVERVARRFAREFQRGRTS
mgnify:CR=1 FL=1